MKRETNLLATGLLLGLLAVLQAGCAGNPKMAQTPAPAAPAQAPAEQPIAAPTGPVLSGKVVETMNAGGYTYLRLEKDGVKTWSAVRETTVKVGDEVEVLPGMPMGNFTSKALDRTFDRIIFSDGLAPKK